jgi:DNA polymerase III delta subunit
MFDGTMGSMKQYNSYIKSLNTGILPKMCFFLGDEDFLKDEAEKILFARVCAASKGMDVTRLVFHCPGTTAAEAEGYCSCSSLFGGYRFIVLDEFEGWSTGEQNSFLNFLSTSGVAPGTILIVKGTVRKLPVSVPESSVHIFWKFFESGLIKWASDRLKTAGIKVSSEIARHLVDVYAGEDIKTLRYLAAEIDKLILYLGSDEELTSKIVREVCSTPPQSEMFRFINSLVKRELRPCSKYARELFEASPSSITGYISVLSSSFSNLVMLKAVSLVFSDSWNELLSLSRRRQARFLAKGERALIDKQIVSIRKELAVQAGEALASPLSAGTVFSFSKNILDVENFTTQELASALSLITTAEHSLKAGKGNPLVELDILVTRICTRGLL